MKHPNRYTSKLSLKSKKKSFHLSGELILCLLICIVSLLALTRYMSTAPGRSPSVYTPPNPNHQTQRMSLMTETLKRHVEVLDIDGVKEANEKLTFYIPDFHGSVHYEFDFGNEKTLSATEENIRYSYPSHGTYKVKLYGTYKGHRKLLATKRLNIQKAIAVSDDAYEEEEE